MQTANEENMVKNVYAFSTAVDWIMTRSWSRKTRTIFFSIVKDDTFSTTSGNSAEKYFFVPQQ